MADIQNQSTRSNQSISSELVVPKRTLDLEPNPFERSFARSDDAPTGANFKKQPDIPLITVPPVTKGDTESTKQTFDSIASNMNDLSGANQQPKLTTAFSISNIENTGMTPPVLTPGGSKRLPSTSLLPPLPGVLSPGGNSFIGTPGLWSTLFPQTPAISVNQLPTLINAINPNSPASNIQQSTTQSKAEVQDQVPETDQGERFTNVNQSTTKDSNAQMNTIAGMFRSQLDTAQQQKQHQQQQGLQNNQQGLLNNSQQQSQLNLQSQNIQNNQQQQAYLNALEQHHLYNIIMNAKKSGLTPNESSLRSGLTTGASGNLLSQLSQITSVANNNSFASQSTSNAPRTNSTTPTDPNSLSNNTTPVVTMNMNMKQSMNSSNPTVGNAPAANLSAANLQNYLALTQTGALTPQLLNILNMNNPISQQFNDTLVDPLKHQPNKHNISDPNLVAAANLNNPNNANIKNINSTMTQLNQDVLNGNHVSNLLAGSNPNLNIQPTSVQLNQNILDSNMASGIGKLPELANSHGNINGADEMSQSLKAAPAITNKGRKRKKASEDTNSKSSSPEKKKIKKKRGALSEEEKRQNFLERNRAAASRCRQRKKEMVEQMKKDLSDYKTENESLREQIDQLRDYALTLRTILYAHKDCSSIIEQVGGEQVLSTVFNGTSMMPKIPGAGESSEESRMSNVLPPFLRETQPSVIITRPEGSENGGNNEDDDDEDDEEEEEDDDDDDNNDNASNNNNSNSDG
ncbi:hypothetical protein DAMA08_050310 [Martiniozyma asiatica (nom. inval.)]|nr:hypothetical protein DAMA08_050310 [Martiniozyma asiatica]